MSRTLKTIAIFALIAAYLSVSAFADDTAKPKKKQDKKHGKPGISLLNPDSLDGWGYFLVKEEGAEKAPEMADVWSIAKGVLSCKGVPMGYLSTEKTYENFRLTFQWRWPKDTEPTNSGVFLRITGEDRALPKCVELQLKHKSAGDLIGFHGMTLEGPADRLVKKENEIGGKLCILPKTEDAELPAGEWNQGKVIVNGDTITVFVNGKKVNQATGVPANAGKIGLQSEGGPIEFRKVNVKVIKPKK